jgi:signal transduction histidine kinase
MQNSSVRTNTVLATLLGVLLLAGLYLTSLYNYLLFHSLVELFTIVVAAGIFMIAWNARGYLNNNYLLFLGIAAIFIAFLDIFHTLAYKGMGVFADPSANTATQVWVGMQYLQGLSLLVAPIFIGRKLKVGPQLAAYLLVTALLLGSIFAWHVFPVAYVQGHGLTSFKIASEYIIVACFLASIGILLWKRREFDATVLRFLILFLAFTIASEIAFTEYVSVYGSANLVGHLLRLVAFFFLYKAIIETGLERPYAILLRDLQRSEESLRQRAAELQTRSEELDAYDHTVAHNLKNPLTVIIASAEAITDIGDLTPFEQREFMEQIKATAFEMNSIIDNLLLLAELRKAEAPAEPVNMARVVAKIRKRLGYIIKTNQARLVLPKTWPEVSGYGPWIEEVWANYISNAIKYGGPKPCVELGAALQQDGMVRFWVRDQGPGIPPEAQLRLFVPFTQVGHVHQAGHGLGLSIVRSIVEKLGGLVGVESQVGQGSLFYFTLPAASNGKTPPGLQPQPHGLLNLSEQGD